MGNIRALAAKLKTVRGAGALGVSGGRCFRLGGDDPLRLAALALLESEGFASEPEPFSPLARRLLAEPFPLGSSLAARFGLIYIQDRSSMLPPLLLAPGPGAVVLDMCAAPGGKTGLAAALVGRGGLVMGVEPGATRLGVMRNNLRRQGLTQAATVQCAGERLPLPDGSLAHVLLDPPCSGWGTEDRHPGISGLWTGEKVKPLMRLQRKLLRRAAALLAPGGRLLYSTCTTNPDEDEAQVAWACSELGLAHEPLAPVPGFVFEDMGGTDAPGSLKVAAESEGQGFFLALLRAPGDRPVQPEPGAGVRLPGIRLDVRRVEAPEGLDWHGAGPGEYWDFGGRVYFLHREALRLAVPRLRWQGVPVARLKEGALRPDGFARSMLPAAPGPHDLDVEEPETLARVLDGGGLEAGPGPRHAGLFFRGTGLGWLVRRSGRLLWQEK